MNTEQFIRSRAAMGWSRKMVADSLEIDYQKFLIIISALPDVKWPAPHTTATRVRAAESRRGVCSPKQKAAAELARRIRYEQAVKYNIAGFIGTTREVYDAWAEFISVSYCQVRRRLDKGVSTFDAFFKPNETHLGWGQNGKYWQ